MLQHAKTHKLVSKPAMSARLLAEYMAASPVRQRTIVRDCKFQPIVRLPQHREAKIAVATFIRTGSENPQILTDAAKELRARSLAEAKYERQRLENCAYFLERFATVCQELDLPAATYLVPGAPASSLVGGVKIALDVSLRIRRVAAKSVQHGLAALRYAKGQALNPEEAAWQCALFWGCLSQNDDDDDKAEKTLCLTIDAYAGECYCAPTNSRSRFKNIEATCLSIAERWDNIRPPSTAVL